MKKTGISDPWWQNTSWLVVVALLSGVWGCQASGTSLNAPTPTERSGQLAPLTFREEDMIGRWETLYSPDSLEVLLLTADHRFVQTFTTTNATRSYQGEGTWSVEQRPSGCVYVHMEGMRYFYGAEAFERFGNRLSPRDDPYPFWERCEESYIRMPDKVILTVASQPHLPRNIELLWPKTSPDRLLMISMYLVADGTGQPFPP